jgi:ABC-type lipoprotein release transport system permease subunit
MANASADAVFAANLSKVSGIAGVTHVLPVSAMVSPSAANTPNVYAIDPSSYFAVAQPASFYFEDPGNEAATQQVLATDGQVLVTGQFAKDAAIQIGDSLILSTTTYPNGTPVSDSVTVQVGGIVRFLPGTFNGYFFGFGAAPDEVYGSYATLGKLIAAQEASGLGYTGSDRFLAALQPEADWKTVKADIFALGSTKVEIYQEDLILITSNPLFSSFLGFARMEIAFIVVILTAGLALIIYAASLERTVEFAGITARGSSGWQTASLLVGEAFSITLIGVAVGLSVGLLAGYLSVSLTYGGISGMESMIPNLFVFPPDGLLFLVLAPAAMLGTTIVVAWRIARMNVARVLKMRSG